MPCEQPSCLPDFHIEVFGEECNLQSEATMEDIFGRGARI
jgi:hypothetical protein